MRNNQGNPQSELSLNETKVLEQREITTGVYLLRLRKREEFKPGQFVALGLKKEEASRLYSIASGTQEDFIDLLYDVKPAGFLTPSLSDLKPGDRVFISKPFGSFLGDEKPAWWIASGTGIAPFVSMFLSGLHQDKFLIHGGKTRNSFYFNEAFSPVLGVNYVRCCSQETGEGLYEGRLTNFLNELKYIPADRKFYLCGSVEMVVEVRDILISRGVPYTNIIAEIFF